jgi:hypothetical protein
MREIRAARAVFTGMDFALLENGVLEICFPDRRAKKKKITPGGREKKDQR